MKYLVVTCIDRELGVEAVCDTYKEALEKMTEHFLNWQRDCGVVEEHIESLKEMIEDDMCMELDDCGFYDSGSCASAWSNTDENNNYDIKIIGIN